MEAKKKIDYKALCEAYIDKIDEVEDGCMLLVYTGKKDEELPIFRVVWANDCTKARIDGKYLWGIVAFDPIDRETQWHNYNDCVNLENWAVLDRLLKKRFGWMEKMDPGLVYEIKLLAKAQLKEAQRKLEALPDYKDPA